MTPLAICLFRNSHPPDWGWRTTAQSRTMQHRELANYIESKKNQRRSREIKMELFCVVNICISSSQLYLHQCQSMWVECIGWLCPCVAPILDLLISIDSGTQSTPHHRMSAVRNVWLINSCGSCSCLDGTRVSVHRHLGMLSCLRITGCKYVHEKRCKT